MSFVYKKLVRPVLFGVSAETAHEITVDSLRIGLGSEFARRIAVKRFAADSAGEVELFGLTFRNPLGIAAGFDKNGVVVNQLASLGFGFVEVGTVTFHPQKGNEKPRLFRLPEDKALINRLGFNNDGVEKVAGRLRALDRKCIVGVNIGKNKDVPNEEATENYLRSFELVHKVADYIAVNISSPNTPNLRELQRSENLEELMSALQERNRELSAKPLLVKIAPDLGEADIESIVDVCIRFNVSGIIATNTTVSREGLRSSGVESIGSGGVSGKPLANRSNVVISSIYRYSKGKLPVIGVGGIFTAEDAFEKIAAGASLLQAYTGFVYRGPAFAREINVGLAAILKERGFANIEAAVGSAVS